MTGLIPAHFQQGFGVLLCSQSLFLLGFFVLPFILNIIALPLCHRRTAWLLFPSCGIFLDSFSPLESAQQGPTDGWERKKNLPRNKNLLRKENNKLGNHFRVKTK